MNFWRDMYKPLLLMLTLGLILLFITAALASEPNAVEEGEGEEAALKAESDTGGEGEEEEEEPVRVRVPVEARGIYLSGYVAGGKERRESLFQLIDETKLNAVVIDYKDSTGKVSYETQVPLARGIGAGENKIADLPELLADLNERGIYTIARLVVFQDPILAAGKPDWALKSKSSGGIWRDRKKLAWTDPHSKDVWDYNIALAAEAAELGFKEIQWDYVRFPSDGAIKDASYPYADGRSKAEVIRDFLSYAREKLSTYPIYVSADIFGLITSVDNDQGIGQYFEDVAGAVDYISPMVYPSHYALGTFGLADPNKAPYETVLRSLEDALKRLGEGDGQLRPWLQDFSLGHHYGPEEVRAQIRAAEELGLKSWLLWDPANRYTPAALR
ncbi:MAG: putative glycoside hydrolase [Firmicutes bacterium]|nr:putative glycoside hydrolase [Bacillota bacterium]